MVSSVRVYWDVLNLANTTCRCDFFKAPMDVMAVCPCQNKLMPTIYGIFTHKAPIKTAADDKIWHFFPNFQILFLIFRKNKVWYYMRIVCQQSILTKYRALFVAFEIAAKFEIVVCCKLKGAHYGFKFMTKTNFMLMWAGDEMNKVLNPQDKPWFLVFKTNGPNLWYWYKYEYFLCRLQDWPRNVNVNPFKQNGISNFYQLDQCISVLRLFWCNFSFFSNTL